ncbi:hypothetical protein XarbCFBP8147_18040 [Xanthomonas arboricola]|nr:hypothetical protein XarbCFBP8147_18040 [Xanthomonas arboricola]
MPRKSLHGRTCGVSCERGRARALQPPRRSSEQHARALLAPCTPTISTGPCPPTVAGPYAAWMPRKSLHGRTCGVSREGGRARALQPARRSSEQDASCIACTMHTDYPNRSLPSHRRGTLRGMDAA